MCSPRYQIAFIDEPGLCLILSLSIHFSIANSLSVIYLILLTPDTRSVFLGTFLCYTFVINLFPKFFDIP